MGGLLLLYKEICVDLTLDNVKLVRREGQEAKSYQPFSV